MPEQNSIEPLRLKSYFSGTVEAAMDLARKELGEDALLVNARPSTPETRHLGTYEVVFGTLPKSDAPAIRRVASYLPPPLPPPALNAETAAADETLNTGIVPNVDRLAADMAEMRRQMDRMTRALAAQAPPSLLTSTRIPLPLRHELPALPAPPPPTPVMLQPPRTTVVTPAFSRHDALSVCELDAGLAAAVVHGTPLEDLFTTDATLGRHGLRRAIVMLAGPPGGGKTSTLVKLAARYGLGMSRRTQLLTCDVFRVAAADQLRALASILGIGCDAVETTAALSQALDEHHAKEFILIDTPGIAYGEMEDAAELARFAAEHPEIDVHLVLPASMRPADLSGVVDDFMAFAPSKLLFTRLDETSQYGALVNESARRALPISFLTAGQRIPDDLEPATRRRLAELVLSGGPRTRSRSVGASA